METTKTQINDQEKISTKNRMLLKYDQINNATMTWHGNITTCITTLSEWSKLEELNDQQVITFTNRKGQN